MKTIKIILLIILGIIIAIALTGMYKFNYLANLPGYSVDGNKIQQLKENKYSENKTTEYQEEEYLPEQEVETMIVNIPNLEWNGVDYYIQYSPREVPQTLGVLNATYNAFFDNQHLGESGGIGVVSTTYYGMNYDSVSLNNRVVQVHLIGSYSPAGAMTRLEVEQEIDAVAFQFNTVDSLIVYLNGEIFDWCIADQSNGEGGCPETPKYWIHTK